MKVHSKIGKAMSAVMVAGITGCVLSGAGYCLTQNKAALSIAITCGMVAYHMLIRFLAPAVLVAVTHKKYKHTARWFSEKSWERQLYDRLGVKRWKDRVLTYDPREFSLSEHTLEEIVNNTCHAELTHEVCLILSMASLLFALPFGDVVVFAITATASAAIELVFVIIQRYNRPRLVRLMVKKSEK